MYKVKTSDPEKKYNESPNKLKILIVDDDDNARVSLKDIIKIRGHDVVTLDEGMKCVNRCSTDKFDIIFMDYHINDIDRDIGVLNGTDVTDMVHECFNVDSMVYAYTGDRTQDAVKHFKQSNMQGAFIKPVDPILMIEFMKIVETDRNDQGKLSKLAIKSKNFIYFVKRHTKNSPR